MRESSIGVQISAVSAIYEISRKNPRLLMFAMPQLYELLATKNNWLLIKLVKLFVLFLREEPKLYKKLSSKFRVSSLFSKSRTC